MIPHSFQLAGFTIKVVIDPQLYKEKKITAEAQYTKNQIVIDPTILGIAGLEQCFYHELVHWIYYVMNEHELRMDEKHVDMMAHLLYQSFRSKDDSYSPRELMQHLEIK